MTVMASNTTELKLLVFGRLDSGPESLADVSRIYPKAISDMNSLLITTRMNVSFSYEFYETWGSLDRPVMDLIQTFESKRKSESSPVVGIVGEYYSSLTIPLQLAAKAYHVLQCSPSATSVVLSNKTIYTTFYRTVPPDNYQAPAIVLFLVKMGWTRNVAIVSINDDYGTALGQQLQIECEKRGIQVVVNVAYNGVEPDFTTTASAVKKSGAFVTLLATYEDGMDYLRQAAKFGLVGPDYVYVGGDGAYMIPDVAETDQDWALLQGFIAFSPNDLGNNTEYHQLSQWYSQTYQEELPQSAAPAYDCLVSFAYALNRFLERKNMSAHEFGRLPFDQRLQPQDLTYFVGATGDVSFDANGDPLIKNYRVKNVQGKGQFEDVYIVDAVSGHMYNSAPLVFSTGTTRPPKGYLIKDEISISFTDPGVIIMLILYSACFIMIFSTGILLYQRRHKKVVKQLSLNFMILFVIGLLITLTSIIPFVGVQTRATCMYQQYSLYFGFAIIMNNLFMKLLRVWVLTNVSPKQRKGFQKALYTSRLVLMSTFLVLLHMSVLVIWTLVDPIYPRLIESETRFHYECVSKHHSIFSAILLTWNGCLLVLVYYLARKTTALFSALRESAWISNLCLHVLGSSIILLAIFYPFSPSLTVRFYLRAVVILYIVCVTYFILLGRILLVNLQMDKAVTQYSQSVASRSTQLAPTPVRTVVGWIRDTHDEQKQLVFQVRVKDTSSIFSAWTRAKFVFLPGYYFVVSLMESNEKYHSELDLSRKTSWWMQAVIKTGRSMIGLKNRARRSVTRSSQTSHAPLQENVAQSWIFDAKSLCFQDVDEHGCYIRLGTQNGQLSLLVRCTTVEERGELIETVAGISQFKQAGSDFSFDD